ncbi:MAG: carbon-nitrogen hydrolase family protein [Pseudorhodobacter sp.]|nr:carbon-nitrogen hydrolase family protein [Pseudorhodobacter sp.]
MKIAAAAYPFDWFDSFDAYAAKITKWVTEAAANDTELLVFPEYGAMELASLGGRGVAADIHKALEEVARHSAAVDALHMQLAARHKLHILGASGPAFVEGKPVNRAVFYGPSGILGHQDKQIMTRFERETWDVVPGPGLTVFDTPLGKIGIVICYDSEFPLLARAMVEAGAEILLAPSCTDSLAGYWRVRIGSMARALENQCVVVHAPTVGLCDFCPAVDENIGAAGIYGPPDRGFPPTGVLGQTEMNVPGWAYADVSRDQIAEVRRDGGVLNTTHWAEQPDRISAPVTLRKSD